jgi:BMFP domain-containing protein YqiC
MAQQPRSPGDSGKKPERRETITLHQPPAERGGAVPVNLNVELKEGEKVTHVTAHIEGKGEVLIPITPKPTTVANRPLQIVLNPPFAPHAEGLKNYPHNELVLQVNEGDLTGFEVKKRIGEAHGIPYMAITLWKDEHHTTELHDFENANLGRVYWAFEGDTPSTFETKRDVVELSLGQLRDQLTEHLASSVFLLEKEFDWDHKLDGSARKKQWEVMNAPLPRNQLSFPIHVDKDSYKLKRTDLEEAYYIQNPNWKTTTEKILQKIIDIRTDREQYERNLVHLNDNDKLLRDQLHKISGQLYPPFPDQALYSSIFHHNPPYQVTESLTYQSLISAIESNTRYYNQQLGKYNLLKKEECDLINTYLQFMTRKKLWMLRERVRLIEWELRESEIFKHEDIDIKLKEVLEFKPISFDQTPSRKRSYQCIDFCQCEFGCSLLFQNDKKVEVKKV